MSGIQIPAVIKYFLAFNACIQIIRRQRYVRNLKDVQFLKFPSLIQIISVIYWKGMWGYMKKFWPNCVSRKSRKLDEIHISYKVEKPVLVAMLTKWTTRSFLIWF